VKEVSAPNKRNGVEVSGEERITSSRREEGGQ